MPANTATTEPALEWVGVGKPEDAAGIYFVLTSAETEMGVYQMCE